LKFQEIISISNVQDDDYSALDRFIQKKFEQSALGLAVIQKKDLLKILDEMPEIGSIIYKNIACELTHRLIKANRDIQKLITAFCLALEGE
jgi:hypothetical protein